MNKTTQTTSAAPVDDVHPDDLVAADDRVIGRAFRWSVLAIVLILAGGAAAWWFTRPEPPPPPIPPGPDVPANPLQVSAEAPAITFKDITKAAGINFTHQNGATGDKLLPETMGGGVAFLDFDNDGDQDLLLVNSAPWPGSPLASSLPTHALYQNDGKGRFTDVTAGSGLDVSFYGMGVACGDYNGDGRVDVYITAVGANRLFRNDGAKFVDVTATARVGGDPADWSTSTGFFDADNDGDLDLFVCRYVKWSRQIDFEVNYTLTGLGRAYGPPTNFQGTFPILYRNNGDGTFADISESADLNRTNVAGEPLGKSLGIVFIDPDHDGKVDVMVANDTVQKFFFHNLGGGKFEEMADKVGLAFDRNGNATGAMGIDAAAYRNDAELGICVGNFANEMSSLFLSSGGKMLFNDNAIPEGIGAPTRQRLKFGTLFLDADLDGRMDILHANGHIEDDINRVQPSQHYEQAGQLFWNTGSSSGASFVEVSAQKAGDLSKAIVGRGAACADIDGDGDLDAILTQVHGPPLLLRNDQAIGHHWLRCRLDMLSGLNREAIGAWVEVTAGGITQRRQVSPTRSYLSQVELPLTFGLGTAEKIDSVKVTWPDGTVQDVPPPAVNSAVTIHPSPKG